MSKLPSLLLLALLALTGCSKEQKPEVASNAGPSADAPPTNTAQDSPTNGPAANAPTGMAQNAPSAPVANAHPATPSMPGAPQSPRVAPRTLPLAPELVASAQSGEPTVPAETPGGKDVKLVGICSYTESSITCWSPNGQSAKALEPRLDALLRSNGGNSGRIRYGYKNRAIVFSRPARSNVTYQTPNGENGGSLETQRSDDPFAAGLDVVFASTSPGTATGELVARLQPFDRRMKSAELPLKVGATATVEGFALRILKVGKLEKNDPYANMGMPMMQPGAPAVDVPRWKISVSIDRSRELGGSSLELLGADGNPIVATDERGRPKPLPRPDPRMGYSGYSRPVAQPVGGGDGTTEYILTVDPQYVKRLRFSAMRAEIAHFRNIPLDPRR